MSLPSQGVPRLNELINVAKSVKTPVMSVYVNEDVYSDQEKVRRPTGAGGS